MKRGSQWREGDESEYRQTKKEKQQLKDEGEGGERARGGESERDRKEEEVEEKQQPHRQAKCAGSQKEKQGKCQQTAE